MWVSSILTTNKQGLIYVLANKYNLSFFGYPLNTQELNGKFYVTFYGWTDASITKTEQLFKELEESPLVRHAECHGNSFIISMQQPRETIYFYSPNIIYLKPILVRPNFTQEYVVASWNREDLSKILQLRIPKVKLKLNFIKEQAIQNIGLFAPVNLTEKQQRAFNLAQQEGYYNFPKRSAHLADLAGKSRISMATFQAHLRKAEKKILSTFKDLF